MVKRTVLVDPLAIQPDLDYQVDAEYVEHWLLPFAARQNNPEPDMFPAIPPGRIGRKADGLPLFRFVYLCPFRNAVPVKWRVSPPILPPLRQINRGIGPMCSQQAHEEEDQADGLRKRQLLHTARRLSLNNTVCSHYRTPVPLNSRKDTINANLNCVCQRTWLRSAGLRSTLPGGGSYCPDFSISQYLVYTCMASSPTSS